MTWIQGLNSEINHFVASWRRERAIRSTAAALRKLSDRMLADIGVSRNRIEDHAREAAHKALPLERPARSGQTSLMIRLRLWRARRVAIRELSSLDDRLLRDIGIERDRIPDAVDSILNRRDDLGAIHSRVGLSDVVQLAFLPTQPTPIAWQEETSADGFGWEIDVQELRGRTANANRPPDHLARATAK